MAFDLNQATAFFAALGIAPDEIVDFRAIHDTDRGRPGIPFRATLADAVPTIEHWQAQGFGMFFNVNALDGNGRDAINVQAIRAHMIDYDKGDPDWKVYQSVQAFELPPTGFVVSSPGKFHAYWRVERYSDNARYEALQRKLVTRFNSDHTIVDATRVMRLPGSLHLKNPTAPALVTYYPASGATYNAGSLEWALASVVGSGGGVDRRELGDTALQAPSLEWAVYALNKIDPGQTDRADWLKTTAAFKASIWGLTDDATIRTLWDIWCAQYPGNDPKENDKLWNSIDRTKAGWPYLMRSSGVAPEIMFQNKQQGGPVTTTPVAPPMPAPTGPDASQLSSDASGILTPIEQIDYFDGCTLIVSHGRILTPEGRFLDVGKFNAQYGGKAFVIDANGKITDEPWKAATRGQVYQVPKVDHIRFLPALAPGAVIVDELGRKGVNTYRPAIVDMVEGDASPFVNHLRLMLPTEYDLRITLSYLAHCVQRTGVKALWALLIQSAEGAGKGIILEAMQHALGAPYVYGVNSHELAEGGGKFNAWMRNKLLIIANEIKVDDKRNMMEVLKPMITEARIEIQAKGADQDMEDNLANWIMFTNWKDAIPITRDSRRYAIIYSPMQTAEDINRITGGGDYFPKLYGWLRGEGRKHVAWFLKSYPIEAEFDPIGSAHRAPITSSTAEAIVQSRGRIEQAIMEAVEAGAVGFRGGWLSSVKVAEMIAQQGLRVGPHTLSKAFEGLGYFKIGRANRAYFQENRSQPHLYNIDKNAVITEYGVAQGYE